MLLLPCHPPLAPHPLPLLGAYQVGSFPNWDVWAEWNGRYRDDVRRFLRGDAGVKAALATRLCGSADLYQARATQAWGSR